MRTDKEKIEIMEHALNLIAETFPSQTGLNPQAKVSDPTHVKMRNNHMIIAQAALEEIEK